MRNDIFKLAQEIQGVGLVKKEVRSRLLAIIKNPIFSRELFVTVLEGHDDVLISNTRFSLIDDLDRLLFYTRAIKHQISVIENYQ